MRSPRSTVNGCDGSVLTSSTLSSPRYCGSMRPGVLRHVMPCLSARPERGQHEPRVARRDRDREAGGNERPSAAGASSTPLARVQVVAGVVGVLLARERQLGVEPLDLDRGPASVGEVAGELGALLVGELDPRPVYSGWSTTMPRRTRSRGAPAAAASNGKRR